MQPILKRTLVLCVAAATAAAPLFSPWGLFRSTATAGDNSASTSLLRPSPGGKRGPVRTDSGWSAGTSSVTGRRDNPRGAASRFRSATGSSAGASTPTPSADASLPYQVTRGSLSDFSGNSDKVLGYFATREEAERYAHAMTEALDGQEGHKWNFMVSETSPSNTPASAAVSGSALPRNPVRLAGSIKDYNPICILSSADLRNAMPGLPAQRAEVWAKPLNDAMLKYGIKTPRRQAAFLAQIAVESGRLKYVNEWAGKEGELGNTDGGDGPTYQGGGLLPIRGRANYRAAGNALHIDLENHPELIQRPDIAAQVSAWYWNTQGLNELADRATTYEAFDTISNILGRGNPDLPVRNQQERRQAWDHARKALQRDKPLVDNSLAPAASAP